MLCFKIIVFLVNYYQEKNTIWSIIILTTINVTIQSNVITWIIKFKKFVKKFIFKLLIHYL